MVRVADGYVGFTTMAPYSRELFETAGDNGGKVDLWDEAGSDSFDVIGWRRRRDPGGGDRQLLGHR